MLAVCCGLEPGGDWRRLEETAQCDGESWLVSTGMSLSREGRRLGLKMSSGPGHSQLAWPHRHLICNTTLGNILLLLPHHHQHQQHRQGHHHHHHHQHHHQHREERQQETPGGGEGGCLVGRFPSRLAAGGEEEPWDAMRRPGPGNPGTASHHQSAHHQSTSSLGLSNDEAPQSFLTPSHSPGTPHSPLTITILD